MLLLDVNKLSHDFANANVWCTYGTHLNSMIVEGGPFDHISLESVIHFRYQLES